MRYLPLVLALAASPLAAQEQNACYDRDEGVVPANTFLNMQSTDTWRNLLQIADPALMGQLAGVYYGEIRSPDGLYIAHQYRSFEANGLYQYQDQTCTIGSQIPCSQNQGTGEWRAATWSDGSIYVMAHFSDLIRTSACAGARYQMMQGGIQDEFGTFWQRVQ